MNRITIIIALLFVLILPARVWAQTPPTQPAGVVTTNVGTVNQKADDGASGSYDDEESVPDGGKTDVYEIGGEIENFDVSDPTQLRTMFAGAAAALTPLSVQRNSRALEPKLFVSGQGRICTYKYGQLEKEELTGTYLTKPVPELSETLQLTYQLGPMLGDKYAYAPNDEGIYDFNQFKPLLINGEPPPCSANEQGTEMEAVTTEIASNNGFIGSLGQIVFSFFDLIQNLFFEDKAEATSHQTGNYGQAVERYTTAKEKGSVEYLSYLPEVKKETEEAGGALNTFFPTVLQAYTDEEPHGAQPNFTFGDDKTINTHDFGSNLVEQAAIKTGCMLLPKELQNKFFEEGKCGITVPVTAPSSCTAMIDSWRAADASCKLCNTSTINSTQDPNWVTVPGGNLPPSFIKIIEKAADSYHVPASVILGTMYHEGSFTRTSIEWTEENVRKWSCGEEARMPFCDEAASTAQLPAGWFPSYFDAAEGTQAFWNAVQIVDPTRNSKATTSVCNLMDVIFATAKNLSLSSARVTGDAARQQPPVTQCYSWPLTNRTIPQTCGAWNDNLVAQSSVNYGGYCPQPGKHTPGYPYVDDAPFIDQTINFYDRFSCGR